MFLPSFGFLGLFGFPEVFACSASLVWFLFGLVGERERDREGDGEGEGEREMERERGREREREREMEREMERGRGREGDPPQREQIDECIEDAIFPF